MGAPLAGHFGGQSVGSPPGPRLPRRYKGWPEGRLGAHCLPAASQDDWEQLGEDSENLGFVPAILQVGVGGPSWVVIFRDKIFRGPFLILGPFRALFMFVDQQVGNRPPGGHCNPQFTNHLPLGPLGLSIFSLPALSQPGSFCTLGGPAMGTPSVL